MSFADYTIDHDINWGNVWLNTNYCNAFQFLPALIVHNCFYLIPKYYSYFNTIAANLVIWSASLPLSIRVQTTLHNILTTVMRQIDVHKSKDKGKPHSIWEVSKSVRTSQNDLIRFLISTCYRELSNLTIINRMKTIRTTDKIGRRSSICQPKGFFEFNSFRIGLGRNHIIAYGTVQLLVNLVTVQF